MGYNKLKFGILLEQYVFSVTEKFIGFVDSKNQTRLIRLFNKINKEIPLQVKPSRAEVKAIERMIAIHQFAIEAILAYILRIDKLVEKAEKTIPNTAKNIILIASYLSLKNRYSVALVKIRVLQQKDINSLNDQ